VSNTVIRAILEGRLKTWADAQTPKVLFAPENIGFTKPDDGTLYVEPILIPNVTMNNEVSGARKTLLGLFQVNCWAPKGSGMRPGETLAQSVIDLFPLVPKFGPVSIESTPHADPPIKDDANWVIVPVLVKYRYEST
jgi:hypothetical protein